MNSWMKKIALHYEKTRDLYQEDRLMILFDIDGTILDMRYMVLHVIKSFDRSHGTSFFKNLRFEDIAVHENQVEKLLAKFEIPDENRENILCWYKEHRWTSNAILASHRPFVGVMEVVRWFQMQPNTFVGLNTGRPEFLREDTLRSLNKLGEEYKVHFPNKFLHMNPNGWEKHVAGSKAECVNHFSRSGYRIFAIVDNEPENLNAISKVDKEQEILLLHADTIFESKRRRLPKRTVSGKTYDITELIHEKALPQHIQFVWHGVNDEANLRQFLISNIQWAECDVRLEPTGTDIVLHHDSFDQTSLNEHEDFLFLNDVLNQIKDMGKSIKLDLKEDGTLVGRLIELLKIHRLDDTHLWFNSNVDLVKEKGFRKLKETYPSAIIQCPIKYVTPLIRTPIKAKKTLSMLEDWGINRFSVKWNTPHLRKVLDQIERLGFEVNIYNIPDLESFLKAVLLMPRSITADFNFPQWHYFGRGSGENHQHYEYFFNKLLQSA